MILPLCPKYFRWIHCIVTDGQHNVNHEDFISWKNITGPGEGDSLVDSHKKGPIMKSYNFPDRSPAQLIQTVSTIAGDLRCDDANVTSLYFCIRIWACLHTLEPYSCIIICLGFEFNMVEYVDALGYDYIMFGYVGYLFRLYSLEYHFSSMARSLTIISFLNLILYILEHFL